MSRRQEPVPRRHCPQCITPESTGTPPPELVGKLCTATIGIDGRVCGRQAFTVDPLGRPVCDAEIWTNVVAHQRGSHGQPPSIPVADPPGQHDPELAPVAQELPAEPIVTADDLRTVVREELDVFSTEVLRIPATMGQKQTALHPVGLCDDGRCQPCRAQRSGEHTQARKILAEEIDQAIEYKGRGTVAQMIGRDGSDGLAEVLDEWRDAGRPEPSGDADEQIEVVR